VLTKIGDHASDARLLQVRHLQWHLLHGRLQAFKLHGIAVLLGAVLSMCSLETLKTFMRSPTTKAIVKNKQTDTSTKLRSVG
jgi:hypothetical protein